MGNISVSLPADGTTADVSDYNTPITTIVNAINGGLDNNNIAASAGIATSKLADDGGLFWQVLGRSTLTTPGTTLSVSSFTSKKYLKVLVTMINNGSSFGPFLRFNNDSGSNYSLRLSDNGAADGTFTSQSSITLYSTVDGSAFSTIDILNVATVEKPVIIMTTNTGGSSAAGSPGRRVSQSKWANTSSQINRIDVIASANMATGSEMVILGHD